MVQREVADRFFASPATKAYGAVSVLVQLAAERTGFHPVARTVFRPQPNVDSALVAFRRRELPERFRIGEARGRGRLRAPAQDACPTRSSSPVSPIVHARSRPSPGLAARPSTRAEALAPPEFVELERLLA